MQDTKCEKSMIVCKIIEGGKEWKQRGRWLEEEGKVLKKKG
jgi:hypothetical protein